ncbi:hypothetical protein [Pseudooceanicola aestuarii]|uniref:hypothetical protein n=1 Tax=Pseudooceanicola aestuarii TaxID=2697319 RepID=UPI001EF903CC|nr:hypothetical protein [Pseudooceanicola aestuarii]
MTQRSLIPLIALMIPLPGLSQAQPRACAPRDQVVQRLGSTYGETRRSVGLGANNSMVEVFASDQSGSWTIVMTSPYGLSCLIASGQAFEALTDTLPSEEKGA